MSRRGAKQGTMPSYSKLWRLSRIELLVRYASVRLSLGTRSFVVFARFALSVIIASGVAICAASEIRATDRPRARDLGITPGALAAGPLNAITDVAGVTVGHVTIN